MQTIGDLADGRKNNFDALRLFFAVLVLFSHCFPLLYGLRVLDYMGMATREQYNLGTVAVAGFFMISGYLITQSWQGTKNRSNFFQKRARRIVPGYVGAVLFMLLFVAPLSAHSVRGYWHSAVPQLLMMDAPTAPCLFPWNPVPYHLNGSLWTIRYEVYCYLLVALLGVVGGLRRRSLVLVLFLAILSLNFANARWVLFEPRLILLLGNPNAWPRFLCCFLAGLVFFLYRDRIPFSHSIAFVAAGILTFVLLLWSPMGLPDLVVPTGGAYILFYIAYHPRIRLPRLVPEGFDLSYGIYLYAWPIQQLLIQHFGVDAMNPYRLFLYTLPFIAALATVSWVFVEKPFLKRSSQVTPTLESINLNKMLTP